ncbi:MAG: response regulator transcription factor [Clostridia bacterium]|nr:response regulator transcription factor [Clostridia bacterium]
MSEKHKILVVDDDPNIAQLVRLYLEKEGYQVAVETRGDTAISAFRKDPPALMLLDIMLPGMDGWQVCRNIRQFSNIPIIMLSAKDETFDKVLGLELGADDYVTKPFEGKELVARVKAVLRRWGQSETESGTISFPGLSISLEKYEVHFQGKLIEMPPKELEVLHFLAAHKNRVFTREQLLEQVWGFEFFGDSRTVDVHIKRLREKLQDTEALGWQIRTVWGVGYKFEVK